MARRHFVYASLYECCAAVPPHLTLGKMTSTQTKGITATKTSEQVLWVRNSPPILLRLLLVPLGLLFTGFPIVAAISPTVNFNSTEDAWTGTPLLLCFGLLFLYAALFRGDIRFDTTTRKLIFNSRGLYSICLRVPTDDASAILLYQPKRVFGGSTKLSLRLHSGREVFLSYLSPEEADTVLTQIATVLAIPCIHERSSTK
jgi:hypothetical protein